MATTRVYGNFSVWIENRKLGTFTTGDYTQSTTGETIVNDEGWDGRSRGNPSTALDINEFTPVGGDGTDLDQAFQRGTICKLALSPINGKIHQLQMVITSIGDKTDTNKRTTERSVKFEGGPPTIVG